MAPHLNFSANIPDAPKKQSNPKSISIYNLLLELNISEISSIKQKSNLFFYYGLNIQ